MNKGISTSALAKAKGISNKDLFSQLEALSLIQRTNDAWALLPAGEAKGGTYHNHPKYGQYITWPSDIVLDAAKPATKTQTVNKAAQSATALGKLFNLSANRLNSILSELGWINKSLKGWNVTSSGEAVGGVQKEDHRSGVPYVIWPASITENKSFKETMNELQCTNTPEPNPIPTNNDQGFREKFEAKLRTTDGHYVRSKAEMLIDNWLYMAEIVHAYERKLPIEEDVYCDFYIPTGKVYIEYWGYENDSKYLHRKAEKQKIYEKYGFKLIELEDKDVQNLDDILPRLLLKHGIQSY